MNKTCLIVAAAALTAVSISTTQAQPYALAGDFNGWDNANTIMETNTPGALYSYTMAGTANGGCQYKVIAVPGSWGTTYPGGNFWTFYGANGSNTVYFYPGLTADGWEPLNNRVGQTNDNLGNNAYEIVGDFNGWSTEPAAQMAYAGNGIFTNLYTVPTAGSHSFKFRTPNTWGSAQIGSDFGQNCGNGSFTTTNNNQVLLFQIDLPKGRWLVGNPAPGPVTNRVSFAVDMTQQILLGNFHGGQGYGVFVSGDFNGWPSPGGGVVLTNWPPYNGGSNTNIYYGTNLFVHSPSAASYQYKFTQNDPAGVNGGWETSNNRNLSLPASSANVDQPVVMFSDTYTSDYLQTSVNLTFRVNMNGRTNIYGSTWSGQNVYINGNFLAGGWNPTWNPIGLAGQIMTEEPPTGSGIYTFTYSVPVGNPVDVKYKYAFDDGVNPLDDEAPSGQDHGRTIRTTVTGSYTNALDTFGVQYVEPSFGQLAVGSSSGGTAPLTWLGRPGVMVQQSTNVSGPWTSLPNTDGSQWNIGTYGSNGLISTTNVATSGSAKFYRLIKP